jgi:integrase
MVDPPTMVRTEVHPLSIDEARAFLQSAASDRLEARWVIGLMLGLRQGEVLGLSCPGIDFEHQTSCWAKPPAIA